MAPPFPAAGGPTLPLSADQAFTQVRTVASAIAQQCANYQTAVSGGGVSAQQIANMYAAFYAYNNQLGTYGAIPNIVAYAQTMLGATFDVADSFSAMQSALSATASWISANFPSSGAVNVNGSGQVVWTVFPAASLTALTALVTALAATVG